MAYSPKIQKIVDYLMREIRDGRLKSGDRVPSEYLLSDMFGVHKSTANRAVAALVERGVLKRCLGGAGTIVRGRPESRISIVIPLGGISFTARVLEGAQSAAFKNNYFIDFFQWPSGEDSDSFWRTLASSSTKGLLVYGGSPPVPTPFPVVHVCATPDAPDASWVVTDDFLGGGLMCDHLVSMGHREIAFVSLHFNTATIRRRLEGFLAAMRRHGIDRPEKRIFSPALGYESLPAVVDQIFSELPAVTAMAFDQDPAAARALICLRRKSVRVPEDISVTGYGCVPECRVDTRLATIEQFPAHMGHAAADVLMRLVEDGPGAAPVRKCLPVELVPGESVRRV